MYPLMLKKCVMRSAKCVMVEGAHNIWKRPNTPYYLIAYAM